MDILLLPYQVYWAGHTYTSLTTENLTSKKISLLRNQALIEVVSKDSNFTVSGFIVLNYIDRGYTLPKNYEDMMNISTPKRPIKTWVPKEAKFLNQDLSDFSKLPMPLFEQEYIKNRPISIIVKGKKNKESSDKYFKIELIQKYDKNNNPIYASILRNHKYKVILKNIDFEPHKNFSDAKNKAAINNYHDLLEEYLDVNTDGLHTLAVHKQAAMLVRSGQVFRTEVFFDNGFSNVEFIPSWKDNDKFLKNVKYSPDPKDPYRGIVEVTLKTAPPTRLKEYNLQIIGKGNAGSISKRTIPIKIRPPFKWNPFIFRNYDNIFSFDQIKLPNDFPEYLSPIRVNVKVKNASFLYYQNNDKPKEHLRPLINYDSGDYHYELDLKKKDNTYYMYFSKTRPQNYLNNDVIITSDYFEDYKINVPLVP